MLLTSPRIALVVGLGAIEAGVERFRYRGEEHLAPADTLVLMNPDELHTGRAETADGVGAATEAAMIVSLLGKGGMGAVCEAVHETIGRRVAIKVLRSEYSHNSEVAQRFFNEARAVNIVDHPGIVQISDYGQLPTGVAYLVMEFIQGDDLKHHLDRGVRLTGISVGGLTNDPATPLFGDPAREKRERLESVSAQLRARFGEKVIERARLVPQI